MIKPSVLAEVDYKIEKYIGFFSLVLFELNLVDMHRLKKLCSNQCCGIPYHANTIHVKCKQCEQTLRLRLNPNLVSHKSGSKHLVGSNTTPDWSAD